MRQRDWQMGSSLRFFWYLQMASNRTETIPTGWSELIEHGYKHLAERTARHCCVFALFAILRNKITKKTK